MFRLTSDARLRTIVLAVLAWLAVAGPARAQHPHQARVATAAHASAVAPVGLSEPPPPAAASASDCSPSWLPTFGSLTGVDGLVLEMFVYDDGQGGGPALYVAGAFESAGAVPGTTNLARWDGSDWSSVGGGVDAGVSAFAVFDDGQGGGPALYVGGGFSHAGGVAANAIAKWDGTSWSPLGDGLSDGPLTPSVHSLAVFDDGGGPALYVGGSFFFAGGVIVRNIARWDGQNWSGLGAGMTGGAGGTPQNVNALAVFDDGLGDGPQLYVGGRFDAVDDQPMNRIAKWDGASWSAVGGGVGGGIQPQVHCLSVLDLGTGPVLYVGGSFLQAGGLVMNQITGWDGVHWRNLGGGIGNGGSPALPWIDAIAAFDDGNGPGLYAGGRFAQAGGVVSNHIARWSGSSWSALGTGVSGSSFPDVTCLAVFDDGTGAGPRLHVGGDFTQTGAVEVKNLALWDGSSWSAGGVGPNPGFNDNVRSSVVFDDGLGGGPVLVVSGEFTSIGGVAASHVAQWDGTSWTPLGAGLNGEAYTLAVFDDGRGGGPALYAGGAFTYSVARWDGATWQPVGPGMDDPVWALQVFDDGLGGGPALYAGGDFIGAGVDPGAQYIAKWDGVAWHQLASSGMAGGWFIQGELYTWVDTLEVFDDGSGGGPALYAGGLFTSAGGVPCSRIAKWDGQTWSALGSGVGTGYTFVEDLEVFDDGGGDGPALYATGGFSSIGGVSAQDFAKWDGTSWSEVGGGVPSAADAIMTVFDDGNGPALYIGGLFSSAGAVSANSIARWDGTEFTPLGDGVDEWVATLSSFDAGDGQGPALIVGGRFTNAGDTSDSYLGRWIGCPTTPSPWHNVGYALAGSDGPPLLAGTGTLATASPGTLKLTHARPSALSVLFVSLAGVSAPFKCGTLVPVPVLLQVQLFTNAGGGIPLGWAAWPGGLAGLSLYFQYAVQDPAAACGVALSNALRADVR